MTQLHPLSIEEQLKEETNKLILLTTQKDVLEVKNQIKELKKNAETPTEPAVEPATSDPADEGDGEEDASTEDVTTDKAGYMAEIVAYQVLKKTAQALGKIILVSDGKILVAGDRCLAERCLPLDDVALFQTKTQLTYFKKKFIFQYKSNLKLLPKSILLATETSEDGDVENGEGGDDTSPLKTVTAALTDLGGVAEAGAKIVEEVVKLVNHFQVTTTVKSRDITLPLDALIAEIAGSIPGNNTYLLNFSKIKEAIEIDENKLFQLMGNYSEDTNGNNGENDESVNAEGKSVILLLQEAIVMQHMLDMQKIEILAMTITPLKAEILLQTNKIATLKNEVKKILQEITNGSKLIKQLKSKMESETDPNKKKAIQKDIVKNKETLKANKELQKSKGEEIKNAEKILKELNNKLTKANTNVEMSTKLSKTFSDFVVGITSVADTKSISIFAQAVLREHVLKFKYLLRLRIHSSGGEMITKKILLIFQKTVFLSGCVFSYTLVTTEDGKVVKSGVEVAASQLNFDSNNPSKTGLVDIPIS